MAGGLMTQAQVLVLVVLAIMVCIVFGVAVAMIRPLLTPSPTPAIAEQPEAGVAPTPVSAATSTPISTSTFTPTPTHTSFPTPTYTRVVLDTASPTPSLTPTPTPTETITPTPTRGGSRSTTGGAPHPSPTPTSRFPLKIVGEPVAYETENHYFVILARVTGGNVLLPGYRMIGSHTPTGAGHQSELSCDHLCKASGPGETFPIQEGNLVFESFFYDTGTWSLMLLDPQGRQASDVFQVEIDSEEKMWFYYHFSR